MSALAGRRIRRDPCPFDVVGVGEISVDDVLLVDEVRLGEKARVRRRERLGGGQVIDIALTGRVASLDEIEHLHARKTGDLLRVSVRAGAWLGGADEDALGRLDAYGRALGLAFQIVDDVLDVTADLQTLGKDPGSDREAGKTTFVDLLGVDDQPSLRAVRTIGVPWLSLMCVIVPIRWIRAKRRERRVIASLLDRAQQVTEVGP